MIGHIIYICITTSLSIIIPRLFSRVYRFFKVVRFIPWKDTLYICMRLWFKKENYFTICVQNDKKLYNIFKKSYEDFCQDDFWCKHQITKFEDFVIEYIIDRLSSDTTTYLICSEDLFFAKFNKIYERCIIQEAKLKTVDKF